MTAATVAQPRRTRGWLKKVGGLVKSWNTRYCVLMSETLDYFTSEDCSKLVGTIPLANTRVREVPHDVEKFAFEIRSVSASEKSRIGTNHETVYLLAASSAEERSAWITAIRRTIHYAGGCFGRPLDEQMRIEKLACVLRRRDASFDTPFIVRRCLNYLIEHNAVEKDGIFRVGGRIKVQRDLRDEFDHGVDVDLNQVSECGVSEVSSLLKGYLQSLPDSLIPARYFNRIAPLGLQIQALASGNSPAAAKLTSDDLLIDSSAGNQKDTTELQESLVRRLKETLIEIPIDNFNVLHKVIHFLSLIHTHSETNRMNASNLAVTFWQVVLKPEDSTAEMMEIVADMSIRTVAILIERFRDLFDEETCDSILERAKQAEAQSQFDGRLSSSGDTSNRSRSVLDDASINSHQVLAGSSLASTAVVMRKKEPLLISYEEEERSRTRASGSSRDSVNGDKRKSKPEADDFPTWNQRSEQTEAYTTLKTAYSDLIRQNFDLQTQVESLVGQLNRYRLKFGDLD